MKATPITQNRRKMPPGSAESLPPSHAKPFTPASLSNGHCAGSAGTGDRGHSKPPILHSSSLQTADSSPVMSDSDSLVATSVSSAAPKPLKKRYLAASVSPGDSSPCTPGGTPPSPSPVAGVSPEAATACEALMELARTDGGGGGGRTVSRSSDSSGSERRGSPSETGQPLQTLRQAVWSEVATTLLKQEEDKLVEPPKDDSPMNLSQQCTIRGQQIIEHIIENILDKPMEGQGSPCEPINVSVNNNQEEGIKASIYESLKNDLLKGKTPVSLSGGSSKSAPTTPPGHTSTSAPLPGPAVSHTANTNSVALLQTLQTVASKPAVQTVQGKVAVTSVSPSSSSLPSSVSVSPQAGHHQDVLRLLARNSQLPISVGNSAITITKTPRVTQPGQVSISGATVATAAALSPPTPVSVSLTRTGSSQQQQQLINLGPGGGGQVPSLVLSSQPGGSVVLTGLTGHADQCVLLPATAITSSSQSVILQHAALQQPAAAGQPGPVMIAPAAGQPLLIAAGSKFILAPTVPQQQPTNHKQQPHTTPPTHDNNSDPVNLTVAKPVSTNNPPPQPSPPRPLAHKRPAAVEEDEDSRRRHGKGRKYHQEVTDDGRVGMRTKRRSHRSGEESHQHETGVELRPIFPTEPTSFTEHNNSTPGAASNNQTINHHWKKKLRTVSVGDSSAAGSGSVSVSVSLGQNHHTATAASTANHHQDHFNNAAVKEDTRTMSRVDKRNTLLANNKSKLRAAAASEKL